MAVVALGCGPGIGQRADGGGGEKQIHEARVTGLLGYGTELLEFICNEHERSSADDDGAGSSCSSSTSWASGTATVMAFA